MYTHILISTDGSELAQKGVDHGLALADEFGSKVTIITVTDRLEDTNTRYAEAILSAAKAAAEKMELTVVTLHIPNAAPAAAIVDAAKAQGCDLIVMASHGYRGIKRVLLGSQTARLLLLRIFRFLWSTRPAAGDAPPRRFRRGTQVRL